MSVSLYEGAVKRHQAELESQQRKRATAEGKAADAEAAAGRLEEQASRTSSASIVRSKLQQAERKRKEAVKARQQAAAASGALATAQKKLGEAQTKLTQAQAKVQRTQADKDRRERAQADRRRAQHDRSRDAQLEQVRSEHAALVSHVASQPWATAPAAITVAFIAASPDGEVPLRLDREVAEIQRRVRMTEHRDSVEFVWRMAARAVELMQYLNEDKPHIVHFSGHSNQHGLAFEDADGWTKELGSGQLANLLAVASDRIRLAVFNSCESSAHAEMACSFIDAAIGMEHTVGDDSAKLFAAQFYNSLGFGHSLRKAFDQACVQVQIETGGLSGNPQLYVADGLDADDIYLVSPIG